MLGGAEVLQGKEMSFNNWLDADAAYALASALPEHAAVIVKHNNPCGVALGATPAEAYAKAFACDTVSAFGGIVAFNGAVDAAAAEAMAEVFTEVVVAPSFTDEALAAFGAPTEPPRGAGAAPDRRGARRAADRRVARSRRIATSRRRRQRSGRSCRRGSPPRQEWADLAFAWTVAWRVKSNAIVFAKDGATVGIGAGQMSRVDAAWIAVRKADDRAQGAVMASDAFFPFPDALEVAAEAGVTAVIAPRRVDARRRRRWPRPRHGGWPS